MTLSPFSNEEYYDLSLGEDLVCLDIVDEIFQQGLEHLQHSLSVPKYGHLDYILANPPNNRACCEQYWNQVRQGVEVVIRIWNKTYLVWF